jgi:hypothetical protein
MPGPRYTDWTHVRVRGEREAAAPYVPFARKLLGYLAEQRRLGLAQTQSIEKRLQDGTVVRARFEGEIPIMEIETVAQRLPARDTFLSGLVALPRTQASTTAFGPFAETVLSPFKVGAPDEHWESYFYDASYVPTGGGGIYSKTPQGKPLYADGLKYGGNLDWRNTDESLTVSFVGPASRYFPEGMSFGQWVFFNGDVIFDASELPQFDTNIATVVLSAAIRKPGTLLICTYEKVFSGGGNHHYIRFYRAQLRPSSSSDRWFKATGLPVWQAPRLDKVAAAGMLVLGDPAITAATPLVRIAEAEVPELAGYLYVTCFHFNQSATQARAILPLYQAGPPIASDITEFVVDLADLDDVTFARVSHGVLSDTRVTTTVYSDVCHDLFYGGGFNWVEPVPPSPSDGTYTYGNPVQYIAKSAFYTTNPNQRCTGYPLTASITVSEGCTLSEYPVAVDFVDDVPVYAYLQPRDLATSTTRTGSVTHTCSLSGSATDVVSGGGTQCTTSASVSASQDASADTRSDSSASGDMLGLRCPKADGSGDWLAVRGAQAGTATSIASSSGTQSGSRTDNFTLPIATGSSPTNAGSIPTAMPPMAGTVDFSESLDWDDTTSYVKLWYLDLRYQAAAYSLYTSAQTGSSTAGIAGLAVPPASLPVAIAGSQTTTLDRTIATHVVFNGVEQSSWSATMPTATTTNTTPISNPLPTVMSNLGGLHALQPIFSHHFADAIPTTWTFGQPSDSALVTDDAFLATLPPPGPTQSVTLPATEAYPTVVQNVSDVADNGFGFWVELSPSLETELGQSWFANLATAYTGRYQAYRKGWCFSMPKISGADVSIRAWQTQISSGESVDTLTGGHGLELVGELWPLSRCPFLTSKG